MADNSHATLMSKEGDGGTVPINSARKTSASKSNNSKSSIFKAPNNTGKKDKKPSVSLTPVESLLFFNLVRFNKDPANIDWDKVAQHSSLKNAGSAKVRYRQVQKKYGLDIIPNSRQMKRKTPAIAEDEDDGDGHLGHTPSQKRPNSLGAHGRSSQRHAFRNSAAVQEESDGEGVSPVPAVSNSPVAGPNAFAQHVQGEQQMQGNNGSAVKQEPPVHAARSARLHGQSSKKQRGCGRGQMSSQANNSRFDMGTPQNSGVDVIQGMYSFQHTPNMSNSRQSQLMTPQQQAYDQKLEQMHREHNYGDYGAQWGTYSNPYGQNEPQAQDQNQSYMTQLRDDQYGQIGDASAHTQPLRAYFGAQAMAQAPTATPTQGPAIAMGDTNPSSSMGDGSIQDMRASPMQLLFDEMVQMPDSTTGLADIASEPAGQHKANVGKE